MVNVDRIVELPPLFRGEYLAILQSGRRLKVSRGWRDEVARALGVQLSHTPTRSLEDWIRCLVPQERAVMP